MLFIAAGEASIVCFVHMPIAYPFLYDFVWKRIRNRDSSSFSTHFYIEKDELSLVFPFSFVMSNQGNFRHIRHSLQCAYMGM